MSPKLCPKCGDEVVDPLTGRPRIYCSMTCKRAAGYECTRINRRLIQFENDIIQVRLKRGLWAWYGKRERDREIGRIQTEIEREEARLRSLLVSNAEEESL